MSANSHNVSSLADRLANLAEAYKADVATVMEDAEAAEVDKTGLRRLVSWRNKDAVKRAEQEAIDEQYRFLAGERDEPASIPRGGELAIAIQLFGEHKTVRDVAKTMGISVGKAQKLRVLASAFAGSVHVHVNVNTEHREMTAEDLGDPLLVIDRDRAKCRDKVRAIAAAIKLPDPTPIEVALATEEDDLAIPNFLRRVSA